MEHMATQSEVLANLEADGYTANLRIDDDGSIVSSGLRWDPADVVVDSTARFEGMSNPDDEAILCAITGPSGRRGTLLLPYGPDLTAQQAETVRALAGR
ncbi:MAG: hypothetical protein HKN24_06905 [Acidimicrobiales bacterium]|nr:hypothetical protein [Acidimicrobiales bacterium]